VIKFASIKSAAQSAGKSVRAYGLLSHTAISPTRKREIVSNLFAGRVYARGLSNLCAGRVYACQQSIVFEDAAGVAACFAAVRVDKEVLVLLVKNRLGPVYDATHCQQFQQDTVMWLLIYV
jgi:hypothetical protein